jgi:integrase/recombinase XerD
MVLAGLRRCEVLGLRMADVSVGDRSLFVAEGKGGSPARRPRRRPVPAGAG